MYKLAQFEGDVSDWYGNLHNRDEATRKLMDGNIVRLLYHYSEGGSDMPYATITHVIRYNKTSDHWKPKLFIGRILDIYRNQEPDCYYPKTGTVVRFSKENIAEITDWSDEHIVHPVPLQQNEKIKAFLEEEPNVVYRKSKRGNLISISYKNVSDNVYTIERRD
jgi:hypothetical protein